MGTSIILVGAIVIDILLLTHWSVSNGARKVGVKAQKIGLKTEQKLEDAASYWKQKRAQINAEKSAARLEPLEESRGEFIYKKSGNETPDDEEKSADFSAKDDEPIPDDIAELLNSEESSSPVQAEQNGPDSPQLQIPDLLVLRTLLQLPFLFLQALFELPQKAYFLHL